MIPQIDFSTYIPQIVSLIVIFILLLLVFQLLIIPSLTKEINERNQSIENNIKLAKEYIQQANIAKNELIKIEKDAFQEVARIIAMNKTELEANNSIELQSFEKELSAKIELAIRHISDENKKIEETLINNLSIILKELFAKADIKMDETELQNKLNNIKNVNS